MGIFKRRKADEAFKIQLERESIDRMKNKNNTDFMLPLELEGEDSVWNLNGKAKAPHTITADELNGGNTVGSSNAPSKKAEVDNIPMSSSDNTQSPSSFLYKKMTETRQQALESVVVEEKINPLEPKKTAEATPATVENTKVLENNKPVLPKTQNATAPVIQTKSDKAEISEELDIEALIRSLHELSSGKKEPEKQEKPNSSVAAESTPKVDKISFESTEAVTKNEPDKAPTQENLELDKKDSSLPPAVDPQKAKQAEQRRTSLLARCNAYLEDEDFGVAKIDTEKYKLESVESILKDFETRASQRVMKNFNSNSAPQKQTAVSSIPLTNTEIDTPVIDKQSESAPSSPIVDNKDIISVDDNKNIETPVSDKTVEAPIVKHYFTAPVKPKTEEKAENPNNIDATRVMSKTEVEKITFTSSEANEKTSIFNALNLPKPEEKPNLDKFNIVKEETNVKSDIETAEIDDYNSVEDRNRVLGELVSKRKSASVKALINLMLLIPAICLLTPLISSITSINPLAVYVIELVILIVAAIVNFDSVKSIACLLNKKSDTRLASGLALAVSIIFAIIQTLLKTEFLSISALPLISLLFNSLSDRSYYNLAISNLDLIANSDSKKAVAIIKNKNATSAIVGNSIEGGSLVCCGADAVNIKNFLRYTYCNNPVAKKIKKVGIFGLIASLIIFILTIAFNFNNVSASIYAMCVALSVTAAPATLLTARFPFKVANSRLKLYDSMLTGFRAADELDLCNGVAVSCNDLFPDGTIRLVDMKLLSPNPIDQSMMDAAALTDAMGSPIAGIFKQVSAETSYNQKPLKVDSFVYENKMGISGWVDDRRVFVGNRVLMEAHGFTNLPPVELDKKIMRKGYFPIYLVSDNVPCALLIVKYTPDEEVAYELRRLCNTGTTVLIHNCDPNISEQMICDYFGLYSESVSVMSKQGSEAYETITKQHKSISAGAAYKGNVCGLFATLTASINVKRSIIGMTALYIIFVALGLILLGVSIITPLFVGINTVTAIAFQLVTTLLICLPPLLKRP